MAETYTRPRAFGDVVDGRRTCRKCGVDKPIDHFSQGGDGRWRRYRCKECEGNRFKQWVAAQIAADPEGYKKKVADESRGRKLKLFGMTAEDYDQMFEAQGGVCAICKKPECLPTRWGSFSSRLPIDHDHQTGRVRGLLCHSCNKALGLFKDSPDVLQAAADYLRRGRP
jgi:hypothetical protein